MKYDFILTSDQQALVEQNLELIRRIIDEVKKDGKFEIIGSYAIPTE